MGMMNMNNNSMGMMNANQTPQSMMGYGMNSSTQQNVHMQQNNGYSMNAVAPQMSMGNMSGLQQQQQAPQQQQQALQQQQQAQSMSMNPNQGMMMGNVTGNFGMQNTMNGFQPNQQQQYQNMMMQGQMPQQQQTTTSAFPF